MPEPATNLSVSPTNTIEQVQASAIAPTKYDSTTLQWSIMILVLGSSAGMLFYTQRTGSMLQSLNKISEKQIYTLGKPTKFGPSTKQEADKMRPRIDKDDF
jgi:hypothetical protein